MITALLDASRERPGRRPLTPRERAGWEAYCQAIGEPGIVRLEIASAQEIVTAGLQALRDAAEKCRATDQVCATMEETDSQPRPKEHQQA